MNLQSSLTARFLPPSDVSFAAGLLGNHDDLADLLAFLDEIGIGPEPAGGGPKLAAYRSSRLSGSGDGDSAAVGSGARPGQEGAIDLDVLGGRPDEALALLQPNLGTPALATSGDGPARVRVAAARRLWRPSVPDLGRVVPSHVASLLPESDPDAETALVIPCRDDGHLLLDAMASIRLCAPELFHVVVVDDGSTAPATLAIIDAVEEAGIPVVRQEPGGVSRARNLGFRQTRAASLLHLDADNLLRPGFVPEALRLLNASPSVAVVHGDAQYFGDQHELWSTPAYDPVRLLTGNYLDTFALVRREALEGVGGWDEGVTFGADWALWLTLTEAGWDFAHLPRVGVDYRLRNNSLRSRHSDPVARTSLAVAMANKHRELYARHLDGVIANFTSAVVSSEPRVLPPISFEAEKKIRGLTDQLAALRAELAHQTRLASQARRLAATANPSPAALRRIAETEERAASAEGRLTEIENHCRDAEHRAETARQHAGEARQRADDAEKELFALRATRTFRWLAIPRALYGRLRSSSK